MCSASPPPTPELELPPSGDGAPTREWVLVGVADSSQLGSTERLAELKKMKLTCKNIYWLLKEFVALCPFINHLHVYGVFCKLKWIYLYQISMVGWHITKDDGKYWNLHLNILRFTVSLQLTQTKWRWKSRRRRKRSKIKCRQKVQHSSKVSWLH